VSAQPSLRTPYPTTPVVACRLFPPRSSNKGRDDAHPNLDRHGPPSEPSHVPFAKLSNARSSRTGLAQNRATARPRRYEASDQCGTSVAGGLRAAPALRVRRAGEQQERGGCAVCPFRVWRLAPVSRRVHAAGHREKTLLTPARPVLTPACSGCSPASRLPEPQPLTVSENASNGSIASDRDRGTLPRAMPDQ